MSEPRAAQQALSMLVCSDDRAIAWASPQRVPHRIQFEQPDGKEEAGHPEEALELVECSVVVSHERIYASQIFHSNRRHHRILVGWDEIDGKSRLLDRFLLASKAGKGGRQRAANARIIRPRV